jgi:hypothetical protein
VVLSTGFLPRCPQSTSQAAYPKGCLGYANPADDGLVVRL